MTNPKEITIDGATYVLKEENKRGQWKPEMGESYYTPLPSGYVVSFRCGASLWSGDTMDMWRYSLGLVFRTREEAERACRGQYVRTRVREIAAEAEFGKGSWRVYRWNDRLKVFYDSHCARGIGDIRFPTEALAQKAIDELGDDLLLLMEGE